MNYINYSDKIYVAGHQGLVGSAVYRLLQNSEYGKSKSGKILTISKNDLDLRDNYQVHNWFKKNKPNVVIIAAAKVGGIFANSNYPVDFLLDNLRIQNNLIENSFKFGVNRLLFLGSSCIYPKFANQPIIEDELMKSMLEPTNEWYALAKISGIKLCEAYRKQYDFDAICLMPTNLYGPGDNYHSTNSHVMPALIKKFFEAKLKDLPSVTCWGSGSPMREFLHVDDLAEACIFALEKWNPKDQESPKNASGYPLNFLNVGTGLEISIKDLAEKISKIIEFKGEIIWDKTKPDGTPRKRLNVEKIHSLGWHHKIHINDGIANTINLVSKQFEKLYLDK